MPSTQAQQIIDQLGLRPLEGEGGLFSPTYASSWQTQDGPSGSVAYYMLINEAFSHLHCLTGDEFYHFYLGDPVEMVELLPDGSHRVTVLGQDILNGQTVQHLVPAGNWQGSRLLPGGSFALMGITMTPGYTQDGYQHGNCRKLLEGWPMASDYIHRLTGESVFF